jgi:phage terminase large subunit-like protein
MRLSKDPTWNSKVYKAHKSFTDFSEILWPEKFPPARLRAIRETFIKAGDPTGYAQEYLNDPRDNEDAFIRSQDLLPMRDEHRDQYMEFGCGVDFAISKADTANKTAFNVGGKDLGNYLNLVDRRAGRWDSLEIINEFFAIGRRYEGIVFYAEGGQIFKAIEPVLRKEMLRRDFFLNIVVINPTKDKKARGRAFQARTRAGAFRVDKEAEWYPDWEDVILRFTGDADAIDDDDFDSVAILCKGMEESQPDLEDDDAITEEELDDIRASNEARSAGGRSAITGY